jgi:transposase
MARPYSDDLRRKFLQAYDEGLGSLRELAEVYLVSEAWAKKISARRTRTGQVDRPPWRRGPVSRVTAEVQEWLREAVKQQPDATLKELQEQLQQAKGLRLSIGRLWSALKEIGLRLKKSRSMPKSKTRPKRKNDGEPGGKR